MILLCYDGSASTQRTIAVARETLAHKPAMVLHVWTSARGVSRCRRYGA